MATPFPRLIPAHFCSPGLCFAKPLFGLQKRRIQPGRYTKIFLPRRYSSLRAIHGTGNYPFLFFYELRIKNKEKGIIK
jgi:hypothetical protein